MGTGTIVFHVDVWGVPRTDMSKDIDIEIGKAVMRSIVEEMELEKPGDMGWKSELDAAYGIDYLFVGDDERLTDWTDFGPAFYRALQRLKVKGPPSYYPLKHLDLFYDQIDQLEKQYRELRPIPEDLNPPE